MNEKIKLFINKMNEKGIPLPLLRDNRTGMGSVSLTMLFISFNVFLLGLIGKVSGILGGIDLTQALYWNIMCASLYFGRSLSLKDSSVGGSIPTPKDSNEVK